MSLRLRLALTYILFLIPALIAFSAVVYFIASKRLHNALDDGLIVRIDAIRSALPLEDSGDPTIYRQSTANLDVANSGDFLFKIVASDGQVLYAPSRAASQGLPSTDGIRAGPAHSTNWHSGKRGFRIAYQPFPNGNPSPRGYIIGAISQKQTDDALDEMRNVFLVGGVLVILLTVAPAYILAGGSLRPVRVVADLAAEIERTGDFGKSLPLTSTRGETAELVQTFNAMIARVRRMLLTQREFLANSSHELRRPLTVIRTYIDLLDHPKLSQAERHASINEMRYEAEAMSRLIADLLLLSREGEQTLSLTEVDVSSLCARLYARLREQNQTPHRISFHPTSEAKVMGDAERLEQMVANLLDNAVQYTPVNGDIDLDVSRVNGTVRIRVADNGPGIPEDEQLHIFERFFRGRGAQEVRSDGTGLGLVIVKHVAESHGGRIVFESRPGAGSSFVIELPALTAPG